ncbi:MAG: hypothetical protein ABIW76_16555 [Fibrobacteria bacterium]
MNSSLLFFGLFPILGYLALISFGGRRAALWGALILGMIETGYSVLAFGTLDYISCLALAVLAVSVWASLRSEDDFYFKIQGAMVNAVTAVIMLIAFYGFHRAMLLDAANKYLDFNQLMAQRPELNKDILVETLRVASYQLPAWLILHALLIVYAAANWGKWAWAFVCVPGLFLAMILGLAFAEASVLRGR